MNKRNLLITSGIVFSAVIVIFVIFISSRYLGSVDTASDKNSDAGRVSAPRLSKDNYQPGENLQFSIHGVSESEAEEYEIEVMNVDSVEIETIVEEKYENGDANFKVVPNAGMTPGKYTFKVTDKNGNILYEQDFLWGVLAINTNKSIYLPDEKVDIALGVLDEKGNMVCDANVSLEIKADNGQTVNLNTSDGTIKVNPECKIKAFTQKPDYEASILTGTAGVYEMNLTAVTKNGTYSINDSFEVRNSVPFDVERITATRIYPPEIYPVKIKIKANQDFTGQIIEAISTDFDISRLEESGVVAFGSEASATDYDIPPGSKALVWNVNLRKGDEIEIGYKYKSPEKSPYFYTLGPLQFIQSDSNESIFSELRRWQIAVDGLEFPTRLDRRRTVNTNGSATSTTVYLPNGSNTTGNLILIAGAMGGDSGFITLPGDWNTVNTGGTGFDQARAMVGYKILDGTEGFDGTDDSISVTHSAGQTAFYMITFTTHGSDVEATAITGLTGGGADPPNLAPTWGSGKHHWVAFALHDCWGGSYSVYPDNYTNTDTYWNGGTNCLTVGIAERQIEASSENPTTFSGASANDYRATTIAVKEALIPEPVVKIRSGTKIRGGTIIKKP